MNRRTQIVVAATGVVVIGAVFVWIWPRTPANSRLSSGTDKTSDSANGLTNAAATPTGPLKVEYASPPPHIAPEQSTPTPAAGQAVVKLDEKELAPKNNVGHFERIALNPSQTIPITLSWPDDNTHEDVFVQAVHGGKIDNGGNAKRFSLRESKTISFTFTADRSPGSYEIVLRRGTVEEALQFWVPTGQPGADPPTLK